MPRWLRFVDDAAMWENVKSLYPWLPDGEVSSDYLWDLKSIKSTLSVWLIDDSKDNLNRIIAAYFENRPKKPEAAYILINYDIPTKLNIQNRHKEIKHLKDSYVCKTWHYDFEKLTGKKLVGLAETIFEDIQYGQNDQESLNQIIADSINSDYLPRGKVNSEIITRVKHLLNPE
jgi:hypothetical protein